MYLVIIKLRAMDILRWWINIDLNVSEFILDKEVNKIGCVRGGKYGHEVLMW